MTRTVNFLAAHDGFTLADLTAYEQRHNHANGEENRDGHGENLSWNNGVEGVSDDPVIMAARRRDVMALLSTLFCSRGAIMLSAGDEFGRSQQGNNNAYAQDNAIGWIDWTGRDREIEAHTFTLAALRARCPDFKDIAMLREEDVAWADESGRAMGVAQWEQPERRCVALHFLRSGWTLCVNGSAEPREFHLGDDRCVTVASRSLLLLDPLPR